MANGLEKILDRHAEVIETGFKQPKGQPFRSYAISNLRGGVGKSSIAFNLAYEISRKHSLLVADVCPQCNVTEMLFGDYRPKVNINNALQPMILGPAFGDQPEDISYKVSQHCDDFKGGKGAYAIAGHSELFAFPSMLYQQLNIAHASQQKSAVRNLLGGLKKILDREAQDKKCEKIIIDTSPFYAGGTHLAWCAVEALIVPVRVDEHSIESLHLTFKQLSDPTRDFYTWNERAGGRPTPKIAAIVMTMVGSKSQKKATPDQASRMYIERALALAEEFAKLFHHDEPSDAFVLTDDFHSAGRISGAKRIPISELKVQSFHKVENRRLQVNASAQRYRNQLRYLASMI
ncbi:ParA family protein [Myxococcus sp. CA040A]|uniref:ParA family protein n=1 Tax=Myxococcus sp. CA040A TaxID=2741738 RepID=UPI00157A5E14|nr:ParA family protein [Myxococcus sp. CA040A]NTX09032.1 ParA family protein [Myxococcus sp. CA040A]